MGHGRWVRGVTDTAGLGGLWSVGGGGIVGHHGAVQRRVRGPWARVIISAVAGLLLGGAAVSCGGDDATLKGMTRERPLEVGSVVVTDVTDQGRYGQHDGTFTMKARSGALLVVYFGYTNCPDLCPTTLALVRAARKELGDRAEAIDLAMVSVDPERDTPEIMNGYLSSFTDQFHALHPVSPEELTTAEDAFLASSTIVTDASGTIEVGHSATTYVVDEAGTVILEWPFGVDKETMLHDFRILLNRV